MLRGKYFFQQAIIRIAEFWRELHDKTTPTRHRLRLKMRSSFHRYLWAVVLSTFFFLFTISTESADDGSSGNGGILIYLLGILFFALVGYFSGIYLSSWIKRLSPNNQIRNRVSRHSKSKGSGHSR